MLDESICHFRGVRAFLLLMANPVENSAEPDQTPHYVASALGQHCLPMNLLRISG